VENGLKVVFSTEAGDVQWSFADDAEFRLDVDATVGQSKL
jgi:hypothetical protein